MIHFLSKLCLALFTCCVLAGGCTRSAVEGDKSATANDKDSATAEESTPAAEESAAADRPTPSFYSVGHYDEASDPAADLAETLKLAQSEEKRVLLQVGGDWCPWCILISKYMDNNDAVHELLDRNFVVMKVTYPGDHAEAFLKEYPECAGYPHFYVLDSDGTLLHSQDTEKLEGGEDYDQDAFVNFLETWAPTPKGNQA